MSVKVLVWVRLALAPVTVMVYVPGLACELTAITMVDFPEPGAWTNPGLKLTVTCLGSPLADNVIAELKRFRAVVVTGVFPELPREMAIVAGEALTEKSAGPPEPVAMAISASMRPEPFMLPQPVARL